MFDSTDLVENRFVGLVRGLTVAGRSQPYSAPPPDHRVKLPGRENVVTGNDFTAADLQGLGLRRGVALDQQRWPSGPDVVLDRVPERVEMVLASLPPDESPDRRLLIALLARERERDGQSTRFFRYDDPTMGRVHPVMVRLLGDVQPGEDS